MPFGSGGGSNGRFDYAFFQVFAGAKITNISIRDSSAPQLVQIVAITCP